MLSGSKSEQFWLEHVRAWEGSQQKRHDYCRAHGLSERSFDYWVRRLRPQIGLPQRQVSKRAEEGTFMPVVVTGRVSGLGRAGGGVIEIDYCGATVRVGSDVDGGALRCVLLALRGMA